MKYKSYKDLGYDSYGEYYLSGHFHALRDEYWDSNLPKYCYICFKAYNLVLHHRHYETLGMEEVGRDVILLCKSCHKEVHFDWLLRKIPLTRKALLKRELYLKRRNKSLWWRMLSAKPSQVLDFLVGVFSETYSLKTDRKRQRRVHKSI